MRFSPFVVVMTLLTTIGSSPCFDGTKNDSKDLRGSWEIGDFTLNGKPFPDVVRKGIKITFKVKKMYLSGPEGIGEREYSFTIDPAKKPKAIDATALDGPLKGKTLKGIYELKGNELKLCLPNEEMKGRPTEFKVEKGLNLGLFVAKHSK